MKYLLMICTDPEITPTADEWAAMGADTDAWVTEMDGRGVRLDGERLRPVSDATTLRVREKELLIVDGPFAETKEQICGYDILDCADLDEAIEVAGKHPMARFGAVEVRPFWPL